MPILKGKTPKFGPARVAKIITNFRRKFLNAKSLKFAPARVVEIMNNFSR